MNESEQQRPEEGAMLYERDALSIRAIMLAAGTVVLVVVIVSALLFSLIDWFQTLANRPRSAQLEEVTMPTGAREWATGARSNLDHVRAQRQKRLNTYDWVSRDENIARVPIDEAMRMLAEESSKEGDRQ